MAKTSAARFFTWKTAANRHRSSTRRRASGSITPASGKISRCVLWCATASLSRSADRVGCQQFIMEKYLIRIDSTPDRLVEAGPLVQGSWSRHHDDLGREIRGEFLIDTGAYGAMIDLAVAEMLALSPRGTRSVHGIHGYGTLQFYLGRVLLPAVDAEGRQSLYSTVLECVGVPSLREKSFEHRRRCDRHSRPGVLAQRQRHGR